MDRILLCKPNGKKKQYGNVEGLSAIEPPIWLAILANYYKATKLLDAEVENLSLAETIEEIIMYKPDKVIILATGSHPSAHIQQKDIAEKLFHTLSSSLKIKNTECLWKLPVSPVKWGNPRWDMLPMEKYRAHNWHCWGGIPRKPYGVVYTSIGCPFNCEFCCVKDFYGKTYENRLIEEVVKDFEYLGSKGITNIKLMDELFILNPIRVNSICNEIINLGYDFNIWTYGRIDTVNPQLLEKMRKAGIKWLAYGIESGNENIRLKVLKGKFNNRKIKEVVDMTKDYGIKIVGNYLFGFWEDTLDTMRETLDFAKELNTEYANFYCLVAYPGSKLYDKMVSKKVISGEIKPQQYAQMSPYFKPLPTKTLSWEKVLKFRDEAFDEYHKNPKYLNMIEEVFGKETVNSINDMTKIKLERII